MARQAGDPATEAAALITLACAEPLTGNMERVRALLAEARTVATRANAYQPLLRAAITESDMLEGLGQHELAATVARAGIADARDYGLARTSGAVLAINLAEPLVSLGRWDEAGEVIEHALQLLPPRLSRSSLWRLSGDLALARGDLAAAAEYVASIRSALDRARYKDEHQLPLTRLETELRLAQDRPAEALAVIGDALDRFDLLRSPRYGWPLLAAAARACAPGATAGDRALLTRAAELRERLRTAAGKLAAEGLAQQAHQRTFAAEMLGTDAAAARQDGPGRLGRRGAGLGGGGPALPAGRGPAADGRGSAQRRRPRRGRDGAAPGRRAGPGAGRPAAERRHHPGRPAGQDLTQRRGRAGRGRGQRPAPRFPGPRWDSRPVSTTCSGSSRPGTATGRSPASCSSR